MLSIKIDNARLNAALSKMEKRLPGIQKQIVRKLAFDGLTDIVVSITTGAFDNPKRVDTGRYRAAWGVGSLALGPGRNAKGQFSGKARAVGPTKEALPGDAKGEIVTTEGRTMATITNSVEYAELVENGTLYMRAGHHVAVALQRVAEDGEELILALGTPLLQDAL
jgi:hypothetical protein